MYLVLCSQAQFILKVRTVPAKKQKKQTNKQKKTQNKTKQEHESGYLVAWKDHSHTTFCFARDPLRTLGSATITFKGMPPMTWN